MFIINQSDFLEQEEKRKNKVIDFFIHQRNKIYLNVPDHVWKSQLDLALMTKSQMLKFGIDNPSTFLKTYGDIQNMGLNLNSIDDQGFEGQIILKNNKKYFFRWIIDNEI